MTRARDNADLGDSYGTLGSGVVFPAGHVITAESNGANTTVNASASYITTFATCDITIKKADSKILILSSAQFFRGSAGADIDAKLAYKASTGRSATWGDYTVIIEFEAVGGMGGSVGNFYCQPFLCYLWTHGQDAGTLVNVACGAQAVTGELYSTSATNSRSQMTVLEIQQ